MGRRIRKSMLAGLFAALAIAVTGAPAMANEGTPELEPANYWDNSVPPEFEPANYWDE